MKDVARLARRIAVTVAGTALLAVGALLLVAPGPGMLVILLALVVFAVEYEWARRHLVSVRKRAHAAAVRTAASRAGTAATAAFGVGAIAVGAALIFTDLLPLSGLLTGASVAFAGMTVLGTLAYSRWEIRRSRLPGGTGE